uniref:Uncharacterized protein n=1 Tax=Rhipicephalus appendiculatus TaxID=34631 RepID=A0A131YFE2_RHIAP
MALASLVGGVGPGSCSFLSELPCWGPAAAPEVRIVSMALPRSLCGMGMAMADARGFVLSVSQGISSEKVAGQQWLQCGTEGTDVEEYYRRHHCSNTCFGNTQTKLRDSADRATRAPERNDGPRQMFSGLASILA